MKRQNNTVKSPSPTRYLSALKKTQTFDHEWSSIHLNSHHQQQVNLYHQLVNVASIRFSSGLKTKYSKALIVMLHLHFSIWRKLRSELWSEKASPLPPHHSPSSHPHFCSYRLLHAQDIPQPRKLDQTHTQTEIWIHKAWLPPTVEATQLWAHWPTVWAFKFGCGHFLLKPRLSNCFDSGNTFCFSYHSLVISMLVKGIRGYVFISSNSRLSPPQEVP